MGEDYNRKRNVVCVCSAVKGETVVLISISSSHVSVCQV